MTDLPDLPTDPAVIQLGDNHAPRSCKACGADADYYVFVTGDSVEARQGITLDGDGGWPVNVTLCTDCFGAAPRVGDWSELEGVAVA